MVGWVGTGGVLMGDLPGVLSVDVASGVIRELRQETEDWIW